MSYNITSCKVKKMDNLRFPVSSLTEHERSDWHPEISGDLIELSESSISGDTSDDGWFYVDDFDVSGECSGDFMYYVLENALKKSKGYLNAILIWEGGDSITNLIVDNGKFSNEEYEL